MGAVPIEKGVAVEDRKWQVLLGLVATVIFAVACAPAAPLSTPTPVPSVERAPTPQAVLSPSPVATPTAAPAPAKPTPVAPAEPVAEKPKYGGVLRTLGRADLTNYDVHQVISYLDLHPLAPAYSLLIRSDPKDVNKLVPDLAESWEASADGKVYTFHLRRGVKFHDGTPLTSADVKASFDRIVSPPKGVLSQRQAYFDAVEKIEAPDGFTVRFLLKRPQSAFPAIVSVPFNAVFPKALLDQKVDMKKDLLGTGTFRLKEYIRGVQFVMEKNPDYFVPGRPYLDGIVRYVIPDVGTAKGAFLAGRLDLMQPILPYTDTEMAEWKKQSPDMVVPRASGFALYAFIPNNDKKPWNDIRVRRAVMLALDKDALLEHHFPGKGVRGGYMPPGPWAIPTEELVKLPGWRKTTEADVAEAKRLLAEAGYPKGFSARFIERSSLRDQVDIAVSFKGMLAKVGIDLQLDILENAAYLVIRRTPNFETMGEGAVSVEMGEPDIVLTRYLSGTSGNYAQYKNPRIDQLYREQSQTLDVAERKKMVLEIQRIMMDDLPFMPWAWEGYYAIHSPQVKNYYLPGGLFAGQSMDEVWMAR